MEKIAIALGGNQGDRLGFLQRAVRCILSDVVTDAKSSPIYETTPWGIKDQNDFLNAVIVGLTDWGAPAILNYLKDLERELGRTHCVINGPREIDLDLIAYGASVIDLPGILVPHPRCHERIFVLQPLCDVWPDWHHPQKKRTALQLLSGLTRSDKNEIRSFNAGLVPN